MKYLLKKFNLLLLIGLLISGPIVYLGTATTNQSIILPGDTMQVDGLFYVDNDYNMEGTYSSIFVISKDHATKLQVMMAKLNKKAYVYEMTDDYLHFSALELNLMGTIQFEASVQVSIIRAYLEAMKYDDSINLEFTNRSLCVAYYEYGSPFRIGDEIVEINGVSIENDFENFRNLFNNRKANDILTIIRDGAQIEIILDDENINSFGGYRYFNISYETLYPQISTNYQNVGGPSGGLLQTLFVVDKLLENDLSKGYKIAGTGTMDVDGNVGPIGGVEQKIYTAYADNVDIFFCPEENYEDALKAYNTLENKEKMALVMVRTLEEAIEYLNLCKNSD